MKSVRLLPHLFILLISTAALPAFAETATYGVYHPGATGKSVLRIIDETYEDECLEACQGDKACRGYRREPDGCKLFGAIHDGERGPGAHVLVEADREAEQVKRRAELGFLHPDVFKRLERLEKERLNFADGSFGEVSGGVFESLSAGDPGDAILRLEGLSAFVTNTADALLMSEKALATARSGASRDVHATRRLHEAALSFAALSYLKAIDEVERVQAMQGLATALAASGDRMSASEAGRQALAIRPDEAFQASVETWESETPEGDNGVPNTDGTPVDVAGDNSQLICDNAGSCSLSFFTDDMSENLTAARLELRRDAGPHGALHVALVVGVYKEVEEMFRGGNLIEPGEIVFSRGDGDFFAGSWLQGWSDGDEMRLEFAPSKLGAFLNALQTSETLVIRRGGKLVATLPLVGAKDLLARIDAIQGRAGSADALLAGKAAKDRQALLPAALPIVEVPVVTGRKLDSGVPDHVAKAWLEACEGDGELTAEGQPDRDAAGYDLGGGRSFWLIGCSRGANSSSSFAFIEGPDGVRRVEHEDVGADGVLQLGTDEITDPSAQFSEGRDEEAEQGPGPLLLRSYERGRGIGDCGAVKDYAFDGTSLRLIRFDRMELCRGQINDWPTQYRAVLKVSDAARAEPADTQSGTPWRLTDERLSAPFRECIDANAGDEAPMRACVKDELAGWDRRLNAAYKTLKAQFASGDTGVVTAGAADRLKAAQRAWIASRDATCKVETAMHAELALYWQDFCLLRETAIRAGFLETMVSGGD